MRLASFCQGVLDKAIALFLDWVLMGVQLNAVNIEQVFAEYR
jgi:hypothetical protein